MHYAIKASASPCLYTDIDGLCVDFSIRNCDDLTAPDFVTLTNDPKSSLGYDRFYLG